MNFPPKQSALAALLFFTAGSLSAAPGQFNLAIRAVGATACSPIPLSAVDGVGLESSFEYRFSRFFSLGLTAGFVEFIASPKNDIEKLDPYKRQNMKATWLDLSSRFFPFPASPAGEAYVQMGFGVSPHIHLDQGGKINTYNDYWPNYTYEIFPGYEFYPNDAGTINWNAQASVGYQLNLGQDLGLDLGFQYDYFWPPSDRPLQTLGLKAGVVFFFGKAHIASD